MYLFKNETFHSKMSPQDISNMKNIKNTKAVKNGRIPRKLNFQKKIYIYRYLYQKLWFLKIN